MPRQLRSFLRRLRSPHTHIPPGFPNNSHFGAEYDYLQRLALYGTSTEAASQSPDANTTLRRSTVVPLENLPQDEPKCSICLEDYETGDEKEMALAFNVMRSHSKQPMHDEVGSKSWGFQRMPSLPYTNSFTLRTERLNPITAETQQIVNHLNAFSDRTYRLKRGAFDRAQTNTMMIEEAKRTLEFQGITAQIHFSNPPTVSELLIAYFEIITRDRPTNRARNTATRRRFGSSY
ncbi:MAG: hypothetical protein Q9217_002755 [Psora testacea]